MSDKNAIVAAYDTHQDRTAFGGYYLVRGAGPVLVAGPLATYIVKAVQPAVVLDGLSAIGCGLFSIGIPKNSALKYESALKADKFLLIAQGTRDDLLPAKHIIQATVPAALGVHATDPPKTRTAARVIP